MKRLRIKLIVRIFMMGTVYSIFRCKIKKWVSRLRALTCPHWEIDGALCQVRMIVGYLCQVRLPSVFDGESIPLPTGHALGNFDEDPADVPNFSGHAVKQQIEISADACHAVFGKRFHQVPACPQTRDKNSLFSGLRIKAISFPVGAFAVRIAGGTLDDVELIGRVSSVASPIIFASYLNRLYQDGADHHAPFRSKSSQTFTGHIKRCSTGNKGDHDPERGPYSCPMLHEVSSFAQVGLMRKRSEALRQPEILGIINRTVNDHRYSTLQRVDQDGPQL